MRLRYQTNAFAVHSLLRFRMRNPDPRAGYWYAKDAAAAWAV